MAVTGYFLDYDWNYREILLGFEPLHGTHSGVNLSGVLMDLLHEHQIIDRVLAVTTDNASNNNTLISTLQDSIELLGLDSHITIIRIPCIAHVIQLSLKRLFGHLKASPKNQTTEMEWPEAQMHSFHKNQQKKELVHTLNKVRNSEYPMALIHFLLTMFTGSKSGYLY